MISAQRFPLHFDSRLGFVNRHSLPHSVQEWIRKDIVDDVPYEEMFVPTLSQSKANDLNIAYTRVLKNYIK